MSLGGLFQPSNAAGDDDFGIIASRAAEQLANTRAASQSEQSKAAEDIAKRPQPTKAVTIVQNPDGTITHTTTVKNAPPRDPAAVIQTAGNEPYADFAHNVLTQGAQLGQESLDRLQKTHDTIDQTLATREGRVAVAKELGVRDPADVPGEFIRNGIFGYRAKRQAYEDLISDPEKLKRTLLAKRFGEAEDVAKMLRPFAQDTIATERADRQDSAEARRQHAADMAQFNTVLDNVRSVDMTLTASSGDDAVKKWAAIYGDDYAKRLEPVIRSTYDSYKMNHDLKAAKEARDAAKDERDRDMWDLRVRSLETSIRNTESLINSRENGQREPKKLPEGAGVDAVIDAMDDPNIDQVALRRTALTHLNKFAADIGEANANLRILDREIKVLSNAKYLTDDQKAKLEKKQQQRENLASKNQQLFQAKERLRNAAQAHGMRWGENRTAQPTGGSGQLLSKDDALRKLQQQP